MVACRGDAGSRTRNEPARRGIHRRPRGRRCWRAGRREALASEGYQAAGIEAISRADAGDAWALYHHFEDGSWRCSTPWWSLLQIEAAGKDRSASEDAAQRCGIAWTEGIEAYLDVCLEPAYGRIVIQEAPAVLGNARATEIEEAHPMALLTATLAALKREGELDFEDIELLSADGHDDLRDGAAAAGRRIRRKPRARGQKIIGSLLGGFLQLPERGRSRSRPTAARSSERTRPAWC